MIINIELFLIIVIIESLLVIHVGNSILTEVKNQRKKLLETNELLARRIFTILATIVLFLLYGMGVYTISQSILLLK